jgi:hypothetical protein
VGPHPGFQVNFGFRLVGMGGVAAGDHEGNLALTGPGLFGCTPLLCWRSGLSVSFDLHGWSTSGMNVQVSTCDGLLAPYRYWVA